ncbi:MAG: FeoA family protein [Promethearchaeota archaeon]
MIRTTDLPKQNPSTLITLAELPFNVKGIVKNINAGRKATQRLSGLGITPGVEIIKIRSAPFQGPVEIQIRGTKLGLGHGLAVKIIVQAVK